MEQDNPINRKNLNEDSDRLFLYEVVLSPATGNQSHWSVRRAKMFLKVPYERMSEEMQRIAKLGGKIIKITPIVQQEPSDLTVSSLPWWVEIFTQTPHCLYYFGPFDTLEEAAQHQNGYIEDLLEEGAKGIEVKIKQDQPILLTQELD